MASEGHGSGGGHGHGGDGHSCSGGCEHDHSSDDDRGALYSLYLKIDTNRVQCLNEATEGSGKTVFKPWNDRLDKTQFVESDVDEELLFIIPFTGNVKLKGLIIIGGENYSHPSYVKLFKNRPNMSFDDVQTEADQEFEVQRDDIGALEYPVNAARFSSVHTLYLCFTKNFGHSSEVSTKVYYIGLKGDFMEAQRQEIVITAYEARANPADHHKTSLFDSVSREIT